MAMFDYFPNYVWNLSVSIAMASGAELGEIMDMCQPLLARSEAGEDAGTADFMQEWMKVADKLVDLAAEDEAKGRLLSAGAKLQRAALYYLTAERMQGHGHPGRMVTYDKGLDAFARGVEFARDNVERFEIPYGDKIIPVLLTRAEGVEGPAPAVVYLNGLDSCKELLYWSRLPQALAARGISTLCVDQPGTGETLRKQGLPAISNSEEWGTPVYEWLAAREDINAQRIGITGISLGGYYAPRVCAFEPRFAAGAVWGANHNWIEVQHKRLRREGENPVPHYWSHVQWVFGAEDQDDFFQKAQGMHLNGVMDRIKVPFLVTHGEKDRQISVDYARQSYDQLTNSPRRELKIFTDREGGVEHVGADNMSFGRSYIADWFAETLGGRLS
ncbi:Prolyl oligopeptidase family protein [Pelagibacterium halotolerans]|uniref:Putative hydrolases or acyltransferases (Alpha/beta hydrolase superfamily) n=2 Tax=Pelagibacterium TaxID=1082930 RepID=G4R7B6_PELHB|nr:putative hydrolases or acyltransferases (alpha/beta hydrolase superfamily) [Pelagibacterium halotolerans B2]QJR18889.1 prolyl oligopeptidase family serine peptidase [Pelagibacterium halotolerans]SEA67219.1 Prolyl oligopeptidase family protein [Pelagibacterium halotolerans]